MSSEESRDWSSNLANMAADCRIFAEKTLPEQAICDAFLSIKFCNLREQFRDLHFGYKPVPEIYLSKETFDYYFPPLRYLSELGEDIEDPEVFLEALGCHIIPDGREREGISSKLSIEISKPESNQRQGVVLICWERIVMAVSRLGLGENSLLPLLHVVSVHEHSHAARESKLLATRDRVILSKEETIAQEETYMFLRTRNRSQGDTIEVMAKLMERQPECYHIRIP